MGDTHDTAPGSYDGDGSTTLEAIWGDGFLSPGGAQEVGRIIGDAPVRGRDVLDFGCGTGGAALTLARDHRAGSVVGVDVERYVIEEATTRAATDGFADVARFRRIDPGPLPFADGSFDIVFSKDAILHIEDKVGIYSEIHRVLRPGGRLCVGDWFRGGGSHPDEGVTEFVIAAGDEFHMQTLEDAGAVVSSVGFTDVELEDRRAWYHEEATRELADLRGPMRESYISRFSEAVYEGTAAFWVVLVDVTERGILCPGHLRARKPGG